MINTVQSMQAVRKLTGIGQLEGWRGGYALIVYEGQGLKLN